MDKLINEKLLFGLKENLRILHDYTVNYNMDSLNENEMYYDACVLRTEMICIFIICNKKILSQLFENKDFDLFENILILTKDYTKKHLSELSYFLNHMLPYIETKFKKF